MIVAMKNGSGEDWLSRTICMVETVMFRHGFVDEKPPEQSTAPEATRVDAQRWIRFLASLLGNQKLGVQIGDKTLP